MDRYHNLAIPGNPKVRACVSAYLNGDKRIIDAAFCCVHSLLTQTYGNHEIYIHHDGPLSDDRKHLAQKFRDLDPRVVFLDNLEKKGFWGFPHRMNTAMMQPHADWVLFCNEDGYFTPDFYKIMLHAALHNDAGMAYANTVHSHYNWKVLNVGIGIGRIDMASFITRMDVLKQVDWPEALAGISHADGILASKVGSLTKSVKLDSCLVVHN